MDKLLQWQRQWTSSWSTGAKYTSLGSEEDEDEEKRGDRSYKGEAPPTARIWRQSSNRIILIFLFVIISTSTLLSLQRPLHPSPLPSPLPSYAASHNLTADKENLHVLVPASDGGLELCKLVLSLSILGYNTPHLINWGATFKYEPGQPKYGNSHVEKVSGIVKWLRKLEAHQQQDLVLILDAYDVHMQLPSEMLIHQYHKTNDEYNEFRAKQPGMRHAMEEHGIQQTIIFAAEKKCWPYAVTDPQCYMHPESTLPNDVYGNRTDLQFKDEPEGIWHSYRPRWLNSGVIIGPAQDVLELFVRGYREMPNVLRGSDQGLFMRVLAEQEYMREYWRQKSLEDLDDQIDDRAQSEKRAVQQSAKVGVLETLSDSEKVVEILNPKAKDHAALSIAVKRAKSEYHMGLDYASRISKTDKFSRDDLRQLTFNTTPATGNLTHYPHDCITAEPQLDSLLSPGSNVPPPFPADFPNPQNQPPPPRTWADCALWTDICAHSIPVALHHNGYKIFREWHWPLMWYQRYAREWLEYKGVQAQEAEDEAVEAELMGWRVFRQPAYMAQTGNATIERDEEEVQEVFKMRDVNAGNAWTPDGTKLGLVEMCSANLTELFSGCNAGYGWDCEK